ncbi:hypothetical protein RCL1_008016 [Eukaryota sp. TZLM3-RCL]
MSSEHASISQHASISEHAQLDNAPSSDLNLPLVPPNFSHEGDCNRSSSFYHVDSRTSGTMASPNTEYVDDPQVLDQLVSTSYHSSTKIV